MRDQFLYGCSAAADALTKARLDNLADTGLSVASRMGERDEHVDDDLFFQAGAESGAKKAPELNLLLSKSLKPTLFLSQIPNLLAANISITMGVTGPSRTFVGEELAGINAVLDSALSIDAGECSSALTGGVLNADRDNVLRSVYARGYGLETEFGNVWERNRKGTCLGSAAAFLVLESPRRCNSGGRRPAAMLSEIWLHRPGTGTGTDMRADLIGAALNGPRSACIVTNYTGPRSGFECLEFWEELGCRVPVYSTAGVIGSCLEADFHSGVHFGVRLINGMGWAWPAGAMRTEHVLDSAFSRVIVICMDSTGSEAMAILDAPDE
tara:strand:- start:12134 stop:13108 length:975 start_codon:yes stop_codon:yes gene_type:complete